jgi:uncharacterized protein
VKTAATISQTGRTTVTMSAIRRVVDQIVAQFEPRRVILFGSHATGQAGPDSDVDLLVVIDKPAGPDASLRIRRKIEYLFPLDLIVCDSKRLQNRVAAGDFFLGDAVRCGRVLYEDPDR